MVERKSFLLYMDYWQHVGLLSDKDAGKLFKALFEYVSSGVIPDLTPAATMAFSFIRVKMDRDWGQYQNVVEAKRSNGKLGGRPRKEDKSNNPIEEPKKPSGYLNNLEKPNGYLEKPNITEANLEKHDSDNGTDNDNDNGTISPSISPQTENQVVMAYGALCSALLPFDKLTGAREAAITGLLTTYSLDQVKSAFKKYNASEFCRGGGAKKWVAGFDFAIRPESVAKALDGFYDDAGSKAKPRSKPKATPTVKKRYDDLVE